MADQVVKKVPTPQELHIAKPLDKDGWDANAEVIFREVIEKDPELLEAARKLAPVFRAYRDVAGYKSLGRKIYELK